MSSLWAILYFEFFQSSEGYEKLAKARKHGLSESLGQEKSEDIFDMFGDDEGRAAENPASNGNGSLSVQPFESMLKLSILKHMVVKSGYVL